MRLAVVIENRFKRTPDGRIWDGLFPYAFWCRYLEVFDEVLVISRVGDTTQPQDEAARADGAGVSFAPLPYYHGPRGYVRVLPRLRRALAQGLEASDAVLIRLPSTLSGAALALLGRQHHPYGVEVVGDPGGVFAPGAVDHWLRPFFRVWFVRKQRQACARACTAAYVTSAALQRGYPGCIQPIGCEREATLATHYSDVRLDPSLFAAAPWLAARSPPGLRLMTVGSLAQMYKAPDVLIDAVARCVAAGLDLSLTFVGDGLYRRELEGRAARVAPGRVRFLGELPRREVFRELDRSDLFVLPSRTEGLPRVVIEAMARGLPCIGSAVGGIPELLSSDALFASGSVEALANKITEIVRAPERMKQMASRNLAVARDYAEDRLGERRRAMYRHLRGVTADWLRRR